MFQDTVICKQFLEVALKIQKANANTDKQDLKKNVKVAAGQRKHITQSTDNMQVGENLWFV